MKSCPGICSFGVHRGAVHTIAEVPMSRCGVLKSSYFWHRSDDAYLRFLAEHMATGSD